MLSPNSNITLHKSYPNPVLSGHFTVMTVGSPAFSDWLMTTMSSCKIPIVSISAPLFSQAPSKQMKWEEIPKGFQFGTFGFFLLLFTGYKWIGDSAEHQGSDAKQRITDRWIGDIPLPCLFFSRHLLSFSSCALSTVWTVRRLEMDIKK